MKIAELIKMAEDIIEIGETIKKLAKQESYIDFHYRGAQLYLLANIIEKAGEYYKVEAPGE